MKIKIWTWYTNPFRLGGELRTPIMCEVEADRKIDLGKGYSGWVVSHPKNKIRKYVVESRTGAIVGHSVQQVKKDIQKTTIKKIEEQLLAAKSSLGNLEFISTKEFWQRMRQ